MLFRSWLTVRLVATFALGVKMLRLPQSVAAFALRGRASFLLDLQKRTVRVRAIGRAMTLLTPRSAPPQSPQAWEGTHFDAGHASKLDSFDERHAELCGGGRTRDLQGREAR